MFDITKWTDQGEPNPVHLSLASPEGSGKVDESSRTLSTAEQARDGVDLMHFSPRSAYLPLVLCMAAMLGPTASMYAQSPFPPPGTSGGATLPDAPSATRPVKVDRPAIVNGRPYVRPTKREQFMDYLNDSYGLSALGRTSVATAYGQIKATQDHSSYPANWGGFGERFGTGALATVISGNVRYGMETVFREDMRYIPCHGCSVKRKIGNALLAEVTARHDSDGHRFFTLTPLVSDMSGPIIVNSTVVPGRAAINGVIGSRVRVSVRVGSHLYTEFVSERKHHDPKLE